MTVFFLSSPASPLVAAAPSPLVATSASWPPMAPIESVSPPLLESRSSLRTSAPCWFLIASHSSAVSRLKYRHRLVDPSSGSLSQRFHPSSPAGRHSAPGRAGGASPIVGRRSSIKAVSRSAAEIAIGGSREGPSPSPLSGSDLLGRPPPIRCSPPRSDTGSAAFAAPARSR